MSTQALFHVSALGEQQKAELLGLARAAAAAALTAAEAAPSLPFSGGGQGGGEEDRHIKASAFPQARQKGHSAPRANVNGPTALTPAPLLRGKKDGADTLSLGPGIHAEARGAPIDGRFGGVFVTIWNGRKLRGCVGSVLPTGDIHQTVQDVTRASLMDPRFRDQPVTPDELPHITFEISLLSSALPMTSASDLIPGVHGVIVRHGDRSGCFLPKVAAERSWSAEEFLSHCCTMKAGLPPDAWREPGTQVLLFTAEAFRDVAK